MALMSAKLKARRPLMRVSVLAGPRARRLMNACTVTAVRVVFGNRVTDEGRQLTQTFDRGVGALFLQDFRRVNGDRQGRFRFRGRDIRTRHDDSLGGRFGCRGLNWRVRRSGTRTWRRVLRVRASRLGKELRRRLREPSGGILTCAVRFLSLVSPLVWLGLAVRISDV